MPKKIQDDFKRLIDNKQLSHAYLIFGEEGKNQEEKFIFCQSLANYLENRVFAAPTQLLRETLFILPDDKGVIGIDNIRALKYFLWQKPINSIRRTAIIKDAENLTPEAQNAALKIVEEPPESALIIFIICNEDNIFPALASRLQKIYFCNSDSNRNRRIDTNSSFNQRTKTTDLCGFIEEAIENNQIDQFFEDLINSLKKDPIKNFKQLREILNRLVFMKQFNTNKRLQLKTLLWKKD